MKKRRSVRQYQTSLDRALDPVIDRVSAPLHRFSPNTRLILASALLTAITTFLLAHPLSHTSLEIYREGEVVRRNIVSPADITAVDQQARDSRRATAAASVRPLFKYDPARAETTVSNFRNAWGNFRATEGGDGGRTQSAFYWPEMDGAQVGPFESVIEARNFRAADLERLSGLLQRESAAYIYPDEEAGELTPDIRLTDVRSGVQSNLNTTQSSLRPLSAARESLTQGLQSLNGWSAEEKDALAAALPSLLRPNVTYDRIATEAARAEVVSSLPTAVFTLKRNQIVAREGDTVTPEILARFAAIREQTSNRWQIGSLFGLFVIVSALYWTAWKFTEQRSASTSLALPKRRAFLLIASAVTFEVLLMSAGFVIADSVAMQSAGVPFADPTIITFAIPFAAAALLVTMLVDSQLGLLTGLVSAFFAGLLAPDGVAIACYAMASSSASIYGIKRYRDRQSVTVAGAFVGLVNAAMALAVMFFLHQTFTLNVVLVSLVCGLAGGLLTTIFTAGGLPINESFFGILTDVKLLELSNADLPVLGQLALRAPGTNQHSHAVGQLAEDACRSIDANPLLARIGALYHDIGKLAAPDMFIENQTGDNPHDRLRPTNSARIITSHVTYGLRLAKELHIPQQIADFIPQHHGTRTLHYFLRKAQSQAAPGEVIDENEFRYPGPKPQFKETAIMMVADSCEAAARSLARPDPENVRAIVNKIVDAILGDGQLDECDLTLRELKLIRESIITSLIAIYHARIDYPGFNSPAAEGGESRRNPTLPDSSLDTEERGAGGRRASDNGGGGNNNNLPVYEKPAEVPISRGGEVEDEAVRK